MSSDKGFIKLYRDIRGHWIWSDPEMFRAWVDILMMVNHKDNKIIFDGQLVVVKRGSVITSLRKLSAKWEWSKGKTSRFLDMLESDGMIKQKRDTKKTLLSVENYGVYQSEKATRGTQKRRKMDTDEDTDRDTEWNKQEREECKKNEEEKAPRPKLTDEDIAEGWGFE